MLALGYFERDKQFTPQIKQHFAKALEECKRQGADWLALKVIAAYAPILQSAGSGNSAIALIEPLLASVTEGDTTPLFVGLTNLLGVLQQENINVARAELASD